MKFSIVIANYNSGQYLEEAVLSVLNQDCKDYEIILVDAGSSDESIEIIKKYQSYFSWWCSEPDKGQSDAFNKGFSQARGDYFFWLNADDLLLPGALSSAHRYLKNHKECMWLTFNTMFINKDREIMFVNYGPNWVQYLMHRVGPQVDAATSIFHRSLFEKSQKFDVRLHYTMDYDLWLQFMNLGYQYSRLKKYFYAFRIHTGSKTASKGYNKKIRSQEKITEESIICDKNNFRLLPSIIFVNQFYKLIVCKPFSWVNTMRLRRRAI